MERPSARHVFATLVLAVVVVSFVLPALGGPPTVTVENHADDRTYRITAYAVPDVDQPSAVEFYGTTPDDTRERVPFETLHWTANPNYRNVTVATNHTANERALVPARGNATLALDGYGHESVVVYVLETADTERVVHVGTGRCSTTSHTLALVIQDRDLQKPTRICS